VKFTSPPRGEFGAGLPTCGEVDPGREAVAVGRGSDGWGLPLGYDLPETNRQDSVRDILIVVSDSSITFIPGGYATTW
jgi:hypothetical protein